MEIFVGLSIAFLLIAGMFGIAWAFLWALGKLG